MSRIQFLSCASVGQLAGAEPPTPSHPAHVTGSYGAAACDMTLTTVRSSVESERAKLAAAARVYEGGGGGAGAETLVPGPKTWMCLSLRAWSAFSAW